MLTEIKNKTEHFFVDEQDLRQGFYKSWYRNGQPMVVSHHLNGKLHGDYKRWRDNGQPWIHCHYANGQLDGDYKSWHENGQPLEHCHYVNGSKVEVKELTHSQIESMLGYKVKIIA